MLGEDKGTKNNNSARMKIIDRAIKLYKAQKLRLKADEIVKQGNIQENKSDLRTRMQKAYNKNKTKIKNAEHDTKDSTRQRKIDDLQNRSNSWLGLRERQSFAIKRQEEYKQEQKPNPFRKLTYEEVCNIADEMTEDEIIELGFDNEDDFWDYINSCFSLEEA